MKDFIEEYKKCLESPAYFYNNYCLIKDKDGGLSKPTPITDEQIQALFSVLYPYKRFVRKR